MLDFMAPNHSLYLAKRKVPIKFAAVKVKDVNAEIPTWYSGKGINHAKRGPKAFKANPSRNALNDLLLQIREATMLATVPERLIEAAMKSAPFNSFMIYGVQTIPKRFPERSKITKKKEAEKTFSGCIVLNGSSAFSKRETSTKIIKKVEKSPRRVPSEKIEINLVS
jgi:hypothetical protein